MTFALLSGFILLLCFHPVATEEFYLNDWAVEVDGGRQVADSLAAKYGYVNIGPIGSLESFFQFRRRSHPRRSKRSAHYFTLQMRANPEVKWVEQQVSKRRVKRNFQMPQDPLWHRQWYLLRQEDDYDHQIDHNVIPAWEQGLSGKGIVVTVLDDGIEYNHPDLMNNYDKVASYDFNDEDDDPFPRYTDPQREENRHGTRCAGEVSSAKNGVCGIGVAFNSKIGGVRMLDGTVTDAVEAKSLSLNPQHIDIYSSSWGPDDDGMTVDGPGRLAQRAFLEGVTKGRGGLGSIFVWASGNGGNEGDCCNCDGYTNSIYTLSIGSATSKGGRPWYLEACSSTLAATFSSGRSRAKMITSTDLHHKCTTQHSGTSASAPLAAGFLALALEANPKLTWRDAQHIVVRSARVINRKDSDWVTNGAGRKVSHKYGYGIIDVGDLVDVARTWKIVPEKHVCEIKLDTAKRSVPLSGLRLNLHTDGCKGKDNEIRYLEHVQARISFHATPRGSVRLALTSPCGTRSQLLHYRRFDQGSAGFVKWPFMTTHCWGEDPEGNWGLEIEQDGARTEPALVEWALILHGTKEPPTPEDVDLGRADRADRSQHGSAVPQKSESRWGKDDPSKKENTKASLKESRQLTAILGTMAAVVFCGVLIAATLTVLTRSRRCGNCKNEKGHENMELLKPSSVSGDGDECQNDENC
eukprot:m.29220 g.29220  ORF g.29220 m.29220 type:complete len:693 (+) comp31150_c0_seq3:24-2102(+)